MAKVELIGAKELKAAIEGLPKVYSESLMQKVNAKAAEPLVHRMHLLAPVGLTGNLADSIGIVKSGKNNISELGLIQVGPRRSKGGNAGHLVEFGTKRRRTKKGANRGVMPKNHFVEKAFDQTIGQVQNKQVDELEKQTVAFLKKTVKQ